MTLLYERYVYHARGLDGVTDIKGQDQPVLRQRFRYYGPRMVPVIDPETGLPTNTLEERQVEVFAPGMGGGGASNELTPQNCYTRVDQETVYYVQNLRGDVVSLASEEFVGEGESRQRIEGRVLETVRYTAFGVPQVFRRLAGDIADDQGTRLDHGQRTSVAVPNSGMNEGDYNLFFAADGFFYQQGLGAAAVGMSCDVADDAGRPLADGRARGGGGGADNTGVNEGDYNAFFNDYLSGQRISTESLYSSAAPDSAGSTLYEYGELSFPEHNNRIGYCGYWWDPHLQMYLVRNRWYSPREGRWLTPDPIGYAGGRNLYQYCDNQPWLYTDPMGLSPGGAWVGNTPSYSAGSVEYCSTGPVSSPTTVSQTAGGGGGCGSGNGGGGGGGRKKDVFDHFGVGDDTVNVNTRVGSSPRSETSRQMATEIVQAGCIAECMARKSPEILGKSLLGLAYEYSANKIPGIGKELDKYKSFSPTYEVDEETNEVEFSALDKAGIVYDVLRRALPSIENALNKRVWQSLRASVLFHRESELFYRASHNARTPGLQRQMERHGDRNLSKSVWSGFRSQIFRAASRFTRVSRALLGKFGPLGLAASLAVDAAKVANRVGGQALEDCRKECGNGKQIIVNGCNK